MVRCHILDKTYNDKEEELIKKALLLLEKVTEGFIPLKKEIDTSKELFFELHIVDSNTLDKNVYSYEYPNDFPNPEFPDKTPLGEVYINPTVAISEGHSIEYMLVHGFLHLLGYDHQGKDDTIAMQALEEKLLRFFS